jgi:hypothetical protein
MNNKETLQNYNNRLDVNNTSLSDILSVVDELPTITEPNLQSKEVTPTKETQKINADSDFDGLEQVTVNAIPDEYIIPDGTLDVASNGDVDVTNFKLARVGVYTPPNLQDKTVEITENGTQIITADEGYNGLNQVEVSVNAIEDLTEELTVQDEEITEQETSIDNIIEALKGKAISGGEEMVKYSTTEQVIGTWIDGRKLYRKVLLTGALPNNNSLEVPFNIENVHRIVNVEGISYNGTHGLLFPTSHQADSSCINIYVDYEHSMIGLQTFSDRSSYTEGYIIIEYTKTTD